MYHDYFSVEQFMRDHHRELVAAAAAGRQARTAARAAAQERARLGIARPALALAALAGFGRGLVSVGRRLESMAASARSRQAGVCEEQPTAAGC